MTELPANTVVYNPRRLGFVSGLTAYLLWGVFPIYFHVLKDKVDAWEILAHRIIWSSPVVAAILFRRDALATMRPIFRDRRTVAVLLLSAVLIATNWLLFVVSIATGRLLEASLGYFINPLVTVALGMIFLRERLNRWQLVSLALVVVGVGYLVAHAPSFPSLALGLAFSFAFYALFRKTVNVDAPTGFFMETLLLMPFALVFFFYLHWSGRTVFFSDPGVMMLLVLGGPLTAAPLLLYTNAVRLLPLSTMSFLQYLSPTLQFALAVFAFGEPFDRVRGVAFMFIWAAVGIFVADLLRRRAGEAAERGVATVSTGQPRG